MSAPHEKIVGFIDDFVLIEKHTYLGYPYVVWKKLMPRTNDGLVRVVVYVYPSEGDAKNGTKAGGTGFIVRLTTLTGWHDYAITNRHNIEEFNSRFVRINTNDRKRPIDIFEGEWVCSKSDDIAACELPERRAHFNYDPIWVDWLVTEESARELRIGLGDDLFMVGRFMNHDGKERNIPVVRFGTIAMMPEEPLIVDNKAQESFLIEIRTIAGFSGSPVFIRIPGDARSKDPLFKPNVKDRRLLKQFGYLEKCLGIEWCRVKGETAVMPLLNGSTFDIQVTSGMSGCIPAWKILDFLQRNETLMKKRKDHEDRYGVGQREESSVEYTGAGGTKKQRNRDVPIPSVTREKFFDDLGKVTKRKTR
jgi:hypothetical protein